MATAAVADDQGSAPAPSLNPWRLLRQRNFGFYFTGTMLSNIGSFFQMVAQALLIYHLTGSSLAVGLLSFAQSIGTLVLGPWAGTVADRSDRRRLLILTQITSLSAATGLAVLTFTGIINVPWLIAGALVTGLSGTFSQPATYSMVPSLVPPADLRASLQMYSVTFNIARVAGPVLGVFTINALGYGWAFTVNAVSFLALIAALLVVRPRPTARPERRAEVRDVLRLLSGNPRIAFMLLVVVAMVMTYDPIQTLAPGMVAKVYQAPTNWVGFFIGGLGVSAIIGTLLRTGQPTLPRVAVYVSVFSLGMLIYALAPVAPVALIGPLIGGAGYLLSNTGSQVLLIKEAGEARSGQVMALFIMAFSGFRPIVSLIDGALADNLGLRQAGVIMTLPALLLALVILLRPRLLAQTE